MGPLEAAKPLPPQAASVTRAAGLCVVALGVLVIIGWHMGWTRLIQVREIYRPMAYGAALGFLLVGYALVAASNGRYKAVRSLAAAVVAVIVAFVLIRATGLAIIFESLLPFSDPAMIKIYFGRLAPNAILSFLLAATALWCLTVPSCRDSTIALLGSIIVGIGTTSLLGYATNLTSAYSWRGLQPMAIHGACGFIVLGSTLVYVAWQQARSAEQRIPEWLPVPIGLAIATVSLVLWQALLQDDRSGLANATLVTGCTVAIGLALSVHFGTVARRELRRAERTASELELEILERRHAEAELRHHVENSPLAVIQWDGRGRITRWSGEAQRIFGWTADEVRGRRYRDWRWVHEDDEPAVAAVVKSLRDGAEPHNMIAYRSYRRDGSVAYCEWYNSVYTDERGAVSIFSLVLDVTERKMAEERLHRATSLLRTVSETVPDLMYAKDREGRVLFANPSTLRVLDRAAEEVIGRKDGDWRGSPEQAVRAREDDEQVIASGETHVIEEELNTPGGTRVFLAAKSPLRDERGRIIGTVCVSRDITERKQIEDALRESERHARELADNLSEADRRKDEFLATLAHELRNPLAPIRFALHVLHSSVGADPSARQGLDVIGRQVMQLVRLIDDLLDVSRITRNKIQLRPERVELAALMRAVVESAEPHMKLAGHRLAVRVEDQIILDADATRLVQVFTNLLNNAAKFTPQGGEIVISARRAGGEAEVRVKDSGIGIPSEALSRIFEMFHQVDSTLERSVGGLGIGLTLAKRIVEMHRGTIEAYSDGRDKGAEFIVRLPTATAEQRADRVPPVPLTAGLLQRPLSVLIVDDNVDSAGLLAVLVGESGHETKVVHDGSTALSVFRQMSPDAVLLDIGLPGINGYDVAREMRKSRGDTVHLAAITGWGQPEDLRLAREAGFDAHLTKPADPAVIAGFLESVAHLKSCPGCAQCMRRRLTRHSDTTAGPIFGAGSPRFQGADDGVVRD
jgi:PAS domain S-box-containing protein